MVVRTLVNKLAGITDTSQFREEWIDRAINSRGEKDFYEYELNYNLEENGEPSVNELKEMAQERIDEIFNHRFDPYHYGEIAEEKNGKLICYREITVPKENLKAFLNAVKQGKKYKPKIYSGIGVYWSWDKDVAEAHWAGKGDAVTLVGLVPLNAIDLEQTAFANMDVSTGEEKEINVKEGAKIEIINVLDGNGNSLFEGKVALVANFKKKVLAKYKILSES